MLDFLYNLINPHPCPWGALLTHFCWWRNWGAGGSTTWLGSHSRKWWQQDSNSGGAASRTRALSVASHNTGWPGARSTRPASSRWMPSDAQPTALSSTCCMGAPHCLTFQTQAVIQRIISTRTGEDNSWFLITLLYSTASFLILSAWTCIPPVLESSRPTQDTFHLLDSLVNWDVLPLNESKSSFKGPKLHVTSGSLCPHLLQRSFSHTRFITIPRPSLIYFLTTPLLPAPIATF